MVIYIIVSGMHGQTDIKRIQGGVNFSQNTTINKEKMPEKPNPQKPPPPT
jgi:hypothetical protein